MNEALADVEKALHQTKFFISPNKKILQTILINQWTPEKIQANEQTINNAIQAAQKLEDKCREIENRLKRADAQPSKYIPVGF